MYEGDEFVQNRLSGSEDQRRTVYYVLMRGGITDSFGHIHKDRQENYPYE